MYVQHSQWLPCRCSPGSFPFIVSLSDANTHVQMSPSRFPKPQHPQQFSWTSPDLASGEFLLSPCECHTHPPGSWVTSLCSASHCDAHTLTSPAAGTPNTQALWCVVSLQPWHSDLNTNKHQQKEPLHSGQYLKMKFNEKTCQTTDLVQGVLMRASLC